MPGAMQLHGVALVLAQAAGDQPWWTYATIPLIAGVIGWGTNWLAIKMTFYPLEFVGIPPYLGWQGIIPSRARKMASIATDNSIVKVGDLREVVDNMEPDVIAAQLLRSSAPRIPEIVDAYAADRYPELWAQTPAPVKEAVYARSLELMPKALDRLVGDMTEHIEDILDMRLMVIEQLSADKRLLNRIFLEAGGAELRFLVNSGFVFGALLGVPQMLLQIFFPGPWVLPVTGLAVGYVTNWVAIKLIFEPAEPRQFGPFRLQGMMLKRQEEISEYFAETASHELLTIRHFVNRLLTGPKSDRALALIRRHLETAVDEALGLARTGVQLGIGREQVADIKAYLYDQAVELVDLPLEDEAFVASRSKLVQAEMERNLKDMDPVAFTGLLRPTVEEDEWKLIMVGSVLGGLAGLAQSLLVFAT